MTDYRIHLVVGDITDDVGNRFSTVETPDGRRYTVESFDMRRKEYPLNYRDGYSRRSPRWDLRLGLIEVPEERPK